MGHRATPFPFRVQHYNAKNEGGHTFQSGTKSSRPTLLHWRQGLGVGQKEDPWVVLAKVWAKVKYKFAKLTTPGKTWFLHFNILEPYVEEESRPDEAISSKRPTPF